MSGTEALSIDLAALLLFAMPGFFFLRGLGYKTQSDLLFFMKSMFIGILLAFFVYDKVISEEFLPDLLKDPVLGAAVLTPTAWLIGVGLRLLWEMIPKPPYEF